MRRSSSSPGWTVGSLATVLLAHLAPLVSSQAIPVEPPNLDFSDLGRVAIAGDFDSLSLYQYQGQTLSSPGSNGSQSLLSLLPSGVFVSLESSDAHIEAMCPLMTEDGSMAGIVVGGNFTSLGGVEAQGIALYNPTTSEITPLPGLSGSVSSIFCDPDSRVVYVGGSFSGGNSTNAIAWVTGWTNLPFAGFNGPVTTVSKAPNGNIIFGGSFSGLGNVTTPQEPDGQIISIGSARISAGPSSGRPGFTDPRNIICKTGEGGPGNTWLLADNVPGFWEADLSFGIQPTKLRLYNTDQEGRGTREWRFTALPLNGIMNFSYVDEDGREAFCDARCPLPENNSTFQDFRFVNAVGMDGFRIDISGFYGRGGGLGGIELYQNDIMSYAVNDFNAACGATDNRAQATATGPWVVTPSGQSNADYLTAVLPGPIIDTSSASVVFQPHIKEAGNYSVSIFTPGCIQDNTCQTRGRVTLTGDLGSTGTSNSRPIDTEIFQTNDFDKYDQLYLGFVDTTEDSFQPSVTLTPSPGQSGPLTVVAQRMRFELISSTGGLNGLFEFNPDRAVIDDDFSTSAINRAGTELNDDAEVAAIVVHEDVIYVGGNFTADDYSNILAIRDDEVESLPGEGLNGEVLAMYQTDNVLYVGGSFNNTRDGEREGLNRVAAFSISDGSWQPLGRGVNGMVSSIVPLSLELTEGESEQVISVSGVFTEVLGFDDTEPLTVSNIAIWIPSRRNWLGNLGLSTINFSGQINAQTEVPDRAPLYAGAISSQSNQIRGAVTLADGGSALQPLPLRIQPGQTQSELRKRAVGSQNVTGVVTGLIYDENNLNITVLGGQFTATASDGSFIDNLAFINGSNSDQVTGLGEPLDIGSVILALGTSGTNLFAGGAITGTISGDEVNGIIVYDLSRAELVGNQPSALQGDDVEVYTIATQPESGSVFVGGRFEAAGSLGCPALCVYDAAVSQWSSPGLGISGVVTALYWASNTRLLVAGDLLVNGGSTTMAEYDATSRNFTAFSGASELPGPVTALSAGDREAEQFWVAGESADGDAYLQKFDGTSFVAVEGGFDRGTTIRGLQVFPVSEAHEDTDLVDGDFVLLVLGQLNLRDFGSASGALFNGTHFTPFILTMTADNSPGSLSQAFVQRPQNFFNTNGGGLALGFVVLIGLGISLVLTFILVVAGIIAERIRRKREGYVPAPTQMYDKNQQIERIPPEHLFGNVGPQSGLGRL